MKPTENEIRLFNDSLDRCVADARFMDLFYAKFMGSSPVIAAMFSRVDMTRQKRALKASLYTAMLAADGNEPALEHLRRLSESHRERQIDAELYDRWLECLIASARECDAVPDADVAAAWRIVLRAAIDIMIGISEPPER